MIQIQKGNVIINPRFKTIINYVLGPLLFIALSWNIFHRIREQKDLQHSWTIIRASLSGADSWKFYLVLLLALVNWALETRKWQLLVRSIQAITFLKAFKSVLSGLSLSLFLPNRLGEFFGRMVFMDEGNRLRSVSLSVVGSLAQLLVTMLAGIGGYVYMKNHQLLKTFPLQEFSKFWMTVIMLSVGTGTVLLGLIYYGLPGITRWLEKYKWFSKLDFYVKTVEGFSELFLTRIFILSACRYLVFVVQYILLMQLFEVNIPWDTSGWLVCVLFLVLAIIPTLPVAELGIRGEAGIRLFGLVSTNTLGIIATAGGIWLINLIIPAIAGSLFILGLKLFRKSND
ncbi:MAG: hypothetical protein JWN76_2291 [Chitinophagaceae bacterium]|nr:hypothetical protein [Chitinophagaceae bacterium]